GNPCPRGIYLYHVAVAEPEDGDNTSSLTLSVMSTADQLVAYDPGSGYGTVRLTYTLSGSGPAASCQILAFNPSLDLISTTDAPTEIGTHAVDVVVAGMQECGEWQFLLRAKDTGLTTHRAHTAHPAAACFWYSRWYAVSIQAE